MEFFAEILKGKFKNVIPIADGRYYVSIKKKNNRSNQQNKFYWGALLPLVKKGLQDAGYNEVKTNDDAHEVLKALFLKKHISNSDGVALEMSGSTTELSTIEFNELIGTIQQWAAEFLNVIIPDPGQQLIFAEYDNNLKATIVNGSI